MNAKYALVAALIPITAAFADRATPEIRTTLEGSTQVIEALLIPPTSPASKSVAVHREVKVLNAGPESTEVLIETHPEDHVPGTLYTVFSRSNTGKLTASPLRVLAESEPAPQEFPTTCQGEPRDRRKLSSLSEHSLQKLITIRKKKIALLMERVRLTLAPAVVERVAGLEQQLGLSAGESFSRALPDNELRQRILVLGSMTAKSLPK